MLCFFKLCAEAISHRLVGEIHLFRGDTKNFTHSSFCFVFEYSAHITCKCIGFVQQSFRSREVIGVASVRSC